MELNELAAKVVESVYGGIDNPDYAEESRKMLWRTGLKPNHLSNPVGIESLRQRVYDVIQRDHNPLKEEMCQILKASGGLIYKNKRYFFDETHQHVTCSSSSFAEETPTSIKLMAFLHDEDPAEKVHAWFERGQRLYRRFHRVSHFLTLSLKQCVLGEPMSYGESMTKNRVMELTINGRKYIYARKAGDYEWSLQYAPEQIWERITL